MVMPIGSFEVSKLVCSSLKKEIFKSKKILVIGSGNGYLEEKILTINPSTLIDSMDIKNFLDLKIKLKIRNFIQCDLNNINENLFKEKNYDLIICLEVIEHINNPWALLELQKKLISKEGKIIVSTPNPLNIFSRIHYLINGRFLYFYKHDMLDRYEHTNPIFLWELLKILKYSNLKLLKLVGVSYPMFSKNIFKTFFNMVIYIFSYLIRVRRSMVNPEEINKKDFKTSLYSSQLIYIIGNK